MTKMCVDFWRRGKRKIHANGIGETFHSWGGPWKNHPYKKYLTDFK